MSQATIMIRLTETPSRSKQAGPCWIRLGDETYAAVRARSVAAEVGATITAYGKAVLRRATQTTTERDQWPLVVTGDPVDVVTLRVGTGQYVEAEVIGVTHETPRVMALAS